MEAVDADSRPTATVNDRDPTLTGLPSVVTVSVRVTAANNTGESTPSETVTIKVP